eukprot:TRINITY_DN1117_c0_g1_i2.p4 TRINITY_DN1117_c0_g1~~TRINITY_DN1117_c0_g1_i2.p4  ORF type:complete len:115 (-),score=0.82 TRINITY_DN1117_c0_g1_i2:249-593(-)
MVTGRSSVQFYQHFIQYADSGYQIFLGTQSLHFINMLRELVDKSYTTTFFQQVQQQVFSCLFDYLGLVQVLLMIVIKVIQCSWGQFYGNNFMVCLLNLLVISANINIQILLMKC